MRRLKVGVIGAGTQGQEHCKCYAHIPDAELIAVADPDAERLKRVGEAYKVPNLFANVADMLALKELEAVSIVTPDHLHRAVAVEALDAGKHVLIEKPLATTVEDGVAIVEAARRAGVKTMINFSNRWMSYMIHAKRAVLDGKLGEPVYAYARLSNTLYVPTEMLKSWSARTRLPHWLMSHTIDRVRWLFGGNIRRVFAMSHSGVLQKLGYDTPDVYAAVVEFDSGAIGNFESCWILPKTRPTLVDSKMEIVFSRGAITVDATETTVRIATAESYTYPGTLYMDVWGKPTGFAFEAIAHFVESVLTDKAPGPSLDDGLHILKVTAAIVESAEKKQPIDIA